MQPIHLHFTYIVDDVTGHDRGPLHAKIPFHWTQLFLWSALIAGAAALLYFFGGSAQSTRRPWRLSDLLYIVLVILVPLAYILFLRFRNLRRLRLAWQQNPQTPVSLTLTPGDLFWQTAEGSVRQAWLAYRSASESSKAFFLHPVEGPDIILPKRVMTSTQITDLRLLLQSAIADNRDFPINIAGDSNQVDLADRMNRKS